MTVTPEVKNSLTLVLVVMVVVQYVFVYRTATMLPAAANWPVSAFELQRCAAPPAQCALRYPACALCPRPTDSLRTLTTQAVGEAGFVRLDCIASTKGGKPAGAWRDCWAGEGPMCSLEEPCTPCTDRDIEQCRWCGTYDYTELECNFVEGVGPYCRFEDGVRPCEACCTPRSLGCCPENHSCPDIVYPVAVSPGDVPLVVSLPRCAPS